MDIQTLMDGMSSQWQRERAETQMTLGGLISALDAMPADAGVANLRHAHSYRGYYSDLAFQRNTGTRPAYELLVECRGAMGKAFEGYKGGEYVMGERTPMWIADWGDCGVKLLAVYAHGEIETAEQEW